MQGELEPRAEGGAVGRALRFAMLTTFYPPFHFGGDGMYVRRLAHALARRGHSVDVIHDVDAYRVGGGRETEPLPEPDGVVTHALRSRSSLLATLATHQLGRPVFHGRRIRRILAQGFDVLHFHNVSLVGGPGILAYGTGVKLYTAHEHWLVCPNHILWRHDREPCPGRECIRCVLRAKRPLQPWRAGPWLARQARHVDEFLALSAFSAEKHREFGFPVPMRVLPSFLPDDDSPDGDAADDGAAAGVAAASARPYFLSVGRLEAIKGLQDLIPLFDVGLPAELWIAGSGAYEGALRSLAAGRPSVRFLGRRTPRELRSLYRNAVALVAPSLCYEVFPMVVLEAFREGTPVVARRLGAYPEILEQAGAGLLFESSASLRDALRALLAEPALRARLGAAGAAAFRARWSESVFLSRYFALIHEIAERRGLGDLAAISHVRLAPRTA
jgi:glycosyltransferase involved in cell wall biosynthesis